MTMEQVLMRSLKSSGELSNGRGVTESTLARWVLTIPLCMHVSNALESFCGVTSSNSEQHVELRDSRQVRDDKDLHQFTKWLEAHSPFPDRHADQLIAQGSGLIADRSIDKAVDIGSIALANMTGNFAEVKLSRKDKVNPISSMKNTIRL